MADYRYTLNPAGLKRFFGHMQTEGIPTSKVNRGYLVTIGLKSSNDRAIINVLKSLGFLDTSGNITDLWRGYRDRDMAPVLLATNIRKTYSELFDTYPDAYRKDDEALLNFFRAKTSLGKRAVSAVLTTFKTLCELADFETGKSELAPTTAGTRRERAIPQKEEGVATIPSATALTLNLNIQLQLPATDDFAIYDKLFEAMKKHLINRES
ncbi:MAG: DUF5343 domain-containing protein [Chloroflexi bacterium]|nr:DUF5343 domain-containing protein [Chloroflexota bacterium]